MEAASKDNEVDSCARLFADFNEKLLLLHADLSAAFQKNAQQTPTALAATPSAAAAAEEKPLTGKVLLVDDTEMVLYVIKEKLSSYGLEVDTAASGPEAINMVKNNAINGDTYDLLFMDHMMPEMDGVEAAREIRKLKPEYEKLPIIALSANRDSGMEEFFLANGFNGFIPKPARGNLKEYLKSWLARQ
jgi:CheY-like chemotaxis protein